MKYIKITIRIASSSILRRISAAECKNLERFSQKRVGPEE